MWRSNGKSIYSKKKVDSEDVEDVEWDWEYCQRFATGVKDLTPKQFWDSQPKDIIIMIQGFREQREYEERKHLETLHYNRLNTAILISPNIKGNKVLPKKLYPLPEDRVAVQMTKREQIESWLELDVCITNGKKRGYVDYEGNLFKDKEGKKQIGYFKNNELTYLN